DVASDPRAVSAPTRPRSLIMQPAVAPSQRVTWIAAAIMVALVATLFERVIHSNLAQHPAEDTMLTAPPQAAAVAPPPAASPPAPAASSVTAPSRVASSVAPPPAAAPAAPVEPAPPSPAADKDK